MATSPPSRPSSRRTCVGPSRTVFSTPQSIYNANVSERECDKTPTCLVKQPGIVGESDGARCRESGVAVRVDNVRQRLAHLFRVGGPERAIGRQKNTLKNATGRRNRTPPSEQNGRGNRRGSASASLRNASAGYRLYDVAQSTCDVDKRREVRHYVNNGCPRRGLHRIGGRLFGGEFGLAASGRSKCPHIV